MTRRSPTRSGSGRRWRRPVLRAAALSLFLVLIALQASFSSTVQAQGPAFTVSPATIETYPGQTITFTVTPPSPLPTDGFGVTIRWNQRSLHPPSGPNLGWYSMRFTSSTPQTLRLRSVSRPREFDTTVTFQGYELIRLSREICEDPELDEFGDPISGTGTCTTVSTHRFRQGAPTNISRTITVLPSNPPVEHTNLTVRYGDDRLSDSGWNDFKDTNRDGLEDRSMGPCAVNNTDCVLLWERYSDSGADGMHRVGGGRVWGKLDPDGVPDAGNAPGWASGQFQYSIVLDDQPETGKTFTVTPRVMSGDTSSVTFSPTSVTFTHADDTEALRSKTIMVTPNQDADNKDEFLIITHDLTGDFVGGFKNGQSIRMQFGMTVMDDDKNAPPIITDKAGTAVTPNGSLQIHLPDRPWRRGDDNYWIDVKLAYPEYANIVLSNGGQPLGNPYFVNLEGPFWLREGQFTAWPQFDAARHKVLLKFTPQNWNVPQRVYLRMHRNVEHGTTDELHVSRQYSTWTFPIRYSFDLPGSVPDVKLPPTVTADGQLVPSSEPGSGSPPVTSSSVVRIGGAGSSVEGNPASFQIIADPAPPSGETLDVSVTVSATGDYGVTTGTRTVTIMSGGSAFLDLPTTGDDVDEPDGSVTLTINDGSGYTVDPLFGSMTVPITDDEAEAESNLLPATKLPSDHPTVKYASLITKIYNVYITDHHSDDVHNSRWKRVLKALGHAEYKAYAQSAMTSAEAQQLYDTHGWSRWKPIADAIAYAESYVTPSSPEPEPEPEPETQVEQAESPLVKYAALVTRIYNVYITDHNSDDVHNSRWKTVLKAFGHADYVGYHLDAMTSARAKQIYDDNGWPRWREISAALRDAEDYSP